jgi:AraC-like DNA-binding protein
MRTANSYRQNNTVQNTKGKLKVMRHRSNVGTINSRIILEQNLFSFLIEGHKRVQYAGTDVTINPDQFMLLSAGNCLMSEKITGSGGHYDSILFFFDNEFLTDFLIRHPKSGRSLEWRSDGEPFLVFEKDVFLRNFIESLGLIMTSGQPVTQELQQVKLEELLLYISLSFPETFDKLYRYNYDSDRDLLIRQAVTANMFYTITVEELAFLCNMTLSTFKRHFAKIYGTSPSKWILAKRMEKAAQLLSQKHMIPSEIYQELGYENLSSFIKSFKQVYNTTPKQYQINSLNA